jgi:hypothetical protein
MWKFNIQSSEVCHEGILIPTFYMTNIFLYGLFAVRLKDLYTK